MTTTNSKASKASKATPTIPVTTAQRAAARSLLAALGKDESSARTLLALGGYTDESGAWRNADGLPSLRAYGAALAPRTGQPKGTTWILPAGDARKAALAKGDAYAAWIKAADAIRARLQYWATQSAGYPKVTRRTTTGSKSGSKSSKSTPKVESSAVSGAALRDMVAAVANGRSVKGLSKSDAQAIRDDMREAIAPESQDVTPTATATALQALAASAYRSDALVAACVAYLQAVGEPAPTASKARASK